MSKWCVKMAYGIGFSVEVNAKNREEAIKMARNLVEGTSILLSDDLVDGGSLEFEDVTYAQESLII